MTLEQLRALHQAAPFRPFTIHTADGRQFHVPHSEFLSHSRSGRTVVVHDGEGDGFSILDLLLITELQVGNGTQKRGKSKD